MNSGLNGKNSGALLTLVTCAGVVLTLLCMVSCDNGYDDSYSDDTPVRAQPSTFRLQVPESMYSNTAGKLTTLYCMAATNPDQVPDFVRQNRTAFENVEELRRHTANFRQMALQAAMRGPSYDEAYKGAMDVAGSDPDLGALAPKVAQDMTSTLGDLARLSGFLAELAGSVDGILRNDDQAYHGTSLYQLRTLIDRMGGAEILGPEAWLYVFNASYQCIYPLVAVASR
jgi:hypothetical protein